MTLRVLDPTHEMLPAPVKPAVRPFTLEGKTVGIISNGKEGTKGYFAKLERLLHEGSGRRRGRLAHEIELQRAGGRRHRR